MKKSFLSASKSSPKETYLFCVSKADYTRTEDIKFLPPLKSTEKKAFIKYQNQLVSSLRNENIENHVFMSTPFACENIWQSEFFVGLESLFRLKALMKRKIGFSVACEDKNWQQIIACELSNKDIILRGKEESADLKGYSVLRYSYQAFRYMLSLIGLGKKITKPDLRKIDVLFFTTWFQKTLETYPNDKQDPFFGLLLSTAQEMGVKSGTFCHVDSFIPRNINQIEKLKKDNIYTYAHFLNLWDIMSIMVSLHRQTVNIPPPYTFLKACILNDNSRTKWVQSLHALMIKKVTQKVLKTHPKVKIVHFFEGNCWEKGIKMAFQEMKGAFENQIFGYQHTGFSDMFQKLRASQPYLPEKVLSSGILARDVLIEKFSYPKETITTTCCLRRSLSKMKVLKKEFPNNFKKVLVLLQGSPYDGQFMRKIEDYLRGEDVSVTVRSHPASPLKAKEMPQAFVQSKGDLEEDLKAHDIVLHNGTTAVFEAAYRGIPTIYLDLDFAFQSAPLIGLKSNIFFQEARKTKTFLKITQKLLEQKDQFSRSLKQVHQSYDLFFSLPTQREKRKFIQYIMR